MAILQRVPIVLSLLVLAAHFLRSGSSILFLGVVLLLVTVTVGRPWAARTLQVALVLGSLEWIRTLVSLTRSRLDAGEPAARMIAILGTVAAVTLLSALLFQTRTLRRAYGLDAPTPGPSPFK